MTSMFFSSLGGWVAGKVSSVSRSLLPALSAVALAVAPLFAHGQSTASSPQQLASLDPVVVTASRYEEPRSSASVVVDVIGRDVIEASGASNITEFLDLIPGVTVSRSYGRLGVDATVDIGYLGESGAMGSLVLIDGQRINPFDSGGIRFAQVPISSIDRIEVRKASGGVLYGDRAQGGVINIITRSDDVKDVNLSFGSFGYRKADAYLGFKSGVLSGSVSGFAAETDGYRRNSSAEQNSGRINLGMQTSAGLFSFVARSYNERANLPSYLTLGQFRADPRQIGAFPGRAERSGDSVGLKFEQNGSEQRGFVIDLFSQVTKGKSSDGFGSTDIQNRRTSLLPEYRFLWDKTRLTVGADLLQVEANTDGSKQIAQESQSVFAQASHVLNSGVTLDLGMRRQEVRNEFQGTVGGQVTRASDGKNAFSAGLRVPLSTSVLLRAGAATGYRFPNADELYFWAWGPYRLLGVNPSIRPMVSQETYLEVSQRTQTHNLSAHLRRIRTQDEIGLATNCALPAGGSADCNANLYDTNRVVLSLSAAQRFWFGLRTTASIDLVDAEIASGANDGRRIPLTPRSVFRLSADQKIADWTLIGVAHMRGDMIAAADPQNAQARIPGRTLVDVGLRSRQWSGFSMAAWVRNLTNKSYFDYAAWDGWATLGVYPADGRSFELTAKYQF